MATRSDRELGSFRDDRAAAWDLHVELATRISAVPLPATGGLLGEALASLDVLATGCREVLREHGSHTVAGGTCPVVRLASTAAWTLRELLARWRPRLAALAADSPPGADPVEQERNWPQAAALRADLDRARSELRAVAEQLAEHAGARSLLHEVTSA